MTFFAPWIVILVIASLVGAVVAHLRRSRSRFVVMVVNSVALAVSTLAAVDLWQRSAHHDPFESIRIFVVDDMNAPLLVFAALVSFFVALVAPVRKWKPGSATRMLVAEAILFAGFAVSNEVAFVALWIASYLPFDRELGQSDCRSGCRRGFRIGAIASSGLLVVGLLANRWMPSADSVLPGSIAILLAAMIRQGVVPFQSWLPHLFARAPLPSVLMLCVPQWGTWAALRLFVPDAPPILLSILGAFASFTAVYGAGLALVQKDARRAFGWLFVSETAIVFASLSGTSETGLAGGLLLWLSSGLSLAGLGMALCALEARRGRLSLEGFSGGLESTPRLAGSFLLLGLCSVGFPGTLGFIGTELLIDGSLGTHPQLAIAMVIATVLNGLAVVNMYFRLFCGRRTIANPAIGLRPREYAGFVALVVILSILGLWPRGIVATRVRAAKTAQAIPPVVTAVEPREPTS
ncbi:MAG: hypothetical protein IT350_15070 [Deltaproteobacteria bacterium]|nr:hypothetical protein [Deltaproteobacteria bacterium]